MLAMRRPTYALPSGSFCEDEITFCKLFFHDPGFGQLKEINLVFYDRLGPCSVRTSCVGVNV